MTNTKKRTVTIVMSLIMLLAAFVPAEAAAKKPKVPTKLKVKEVQSTYVN